MIIGVIGGSSCDAKTAKIAEKIGRRIATSGDILVCGGLGGVMEAAARGAYKAGGTTIGILPGKSKEEANPYIRIPIVTAMSHARNAIIVRTADALIAIDGKFGTLSEIALARACDKPVIALLTSWNLPGVVSVKSVEDVFRHIEKLRK